MPNTQQRLETQASPPLTFVADGEGALTFAGQQAQAYTGRTVTALLGSGWLESVHEEDRTATQTRWQQAVADGCAYQHELRLRRHDGRFRWHLCQAEPVRDETGAPLQWVGTCTDIQSGGSAREARAQSQRQFIEIVDRLPVGIGVMTFSGRVLYLNPVALELHGFTSPEAMLTTLDEYREVFELFDPEDGPIPAERWPLALAAREEYVSDYQVRLRRAGAHDRVVSYSTVPVHGDDAEGPRTIFVMYDITERHRSESALKASEARLQAIIDNSPVVLYIKDLDGRYLLANRAYLELFETTSERLLGVTDYERFSKAVADDYRTNDEAVIATGRPLEFEETGVFDGQTRTYLSMKFPLRDADGRINGVCGISTDITEQKRQQQDLRDIDRRKDEFLSMLAHELRNPLAPIANAVQLLTLAEPAADQRRAAVAIIDRQVKHLTHLVDDLLDIARINTGRIRLRRDMVELGELVRQAVENARPRMTSRNLTYTASLPDAPLWLTGDSYRLVQVVDNLLDNAAKYTPPGGAVRIDLHREDAMAVLTVSDTGVGIDEAHLSRIFELFEQVDAGLDHTGGGLGLGLNLVRRLVEKQGGSVHARSEGPGAGSDFVVRLPLTEPAPSDASPAPSGTADTAPGHKRRVLVVEDNTDAAETLKMLLETLGHEVAVANDGRQGIALAADFAPQVAFVDLGLPEVDGYGVARSLRERFGPGIRLVALTGYGNQEHRDRSTAAGFDEHLVKPPAMDDVIRALADCNGG